VVLFHPVWVVKSMAGRAEATMRERRKKPR